MKSLLAIGTTVGLLLVSGISSAAIIDYKATLNGKQETPATASAATGTATLQFNDANRRLSGTITLTGITTTSAQHIHQAACGVAGAPIVTLDPPQSGVITFNNEQLDVAQATALAAGDLYLNIHTTGSPNGEIRGQIYAATSTTQCPAAVDGGTDGGSDSGTSGSSGTSGTSGNTSSGTSGNTSGSNGATTERPDSGTEETPAATDDGGCSTTGGSSDSGSGLAFAGLAIAGVVIANRLNRRKR